MRILLTATYGWPEVYRGGERYVHELAGFLAARPATTCASSSADRDRRATWCAGCR